MEYDRPTREGRKRPFVRKKTTTGATASVGGDGTRPASEKTAPARKKAKTKAKAKDGEAKVSKAKPTEAEIIEREDHAEAADDAEDAGEVLDVTPEVDADLTPVVDGADVADGGDDDAAVAEVEGDVERDEPPGRVAREKGLTRRDPLSVYMNEIRRIPLLPREEETELAKKFYESGDMDIARRLVTANLRLVVKIAHEYRRAHRNLLDLIQEGNIGLLQAMKKYDPYRGVKLSSYAVWWIRAYILKFILNNWRLVKIGTTQAQRKLFFNLRKEKDKLEQLGFAPEHKLLAERLEVTEDEVAEMEKRLEGADMSLDVPVSRDEAGGTTRLDTMASAADERPDNRVESEEWKGLLRRKLEEFASGLKDREEVLFRERWLTDSPLTLQDVGDKFGISRERARQIEKRLLDRLRVYLEQELGTAVDIARGIEE
jgi:RNA polymerase sigma-32 factor